MLGNNITNEDIKQALFDMAPLKASGSDGYHAYFFQNQWDKSRMPFVNGLKEFLAENQLIKGLTTPLSS